MLQGSQIELIDVLEVFAVLLPLISSFEGRSSISSFFNGFFQDNFSSNFRSNFRGNFINEILGLLERNRAEVVK